MARGSALGSVSNTYFRFVSESWLSVNRGVSESCVSES
jgi:hypothetical protein